MSNFTQSQSLVQLDLPAIRIVGIFGTFFYSGFINPWEIVGFVQFLVVKVIQGEPRRISRGTPTVGLTQGDEWFYST
jgi:hypothetical protein